MKVARGHVHSSQRNSSAHEINDSSLLTRGSTVSEVWNIAKTENGYCDTWLCHNRHNFITIVFLYHFFFLVNRILLSSLQCRV